MAWSSCTSISTHVQVRFAREAGVCSTREGDVPYAVGDALLTGAKAEQWPVAARQFAGKYEPLPGTEPGRDGAYAKRRTIVQACRLDAPLSVALPSGTALKGEAGDWRVRYVDGSEAIVGAAFFDALYEPARVPLTFRTDALLEADPASVPMLEALRDDLRRALPHTPVHWIRSGDADAAPAWFLVTVNGAHRHLHAATVIELPFDVAAGAVSGGRALMARIDELREPSGWIAFTLDRLAGAGRRLLEAVGFDLAGRTGVECEAEDLAMILAKQLVSLELFNTSLARADEGGDGNADFVPTPGHYQRPLAAVRPGDRAADDKASGPAALLARFLQIGAVADRRASYWQRRWQRCVLGTTEDLSGSRYEDLGDFEAPGWREPRYLRKRPDARWRLWFCMLVRIANLFSMGLLAAVLMAAFTELAEGCGEERDLIFRTYLACGMEEWHSRSTAALLGGYLAVLFVAWLLYASTQIHHFKHRHQDCRLLAEAVRVHYVLIATGISADICKQIPVGNPAASSWVVKALRALVHQYAPRPFEAATAAAVQRARVMFIRDQIVYHRRTLVGRRRIALKRIDGLAMLSLMLALAALAILAMNGLTRSSPPILSNFVHQLAVVAMLFGLAVWAGLKRLAQAYGWEAEAQRGSIVLNALRLSEQVLQGEPCLERRLDALHDCGKMFVSDQAAWHNLHRARPIEAASAA